MRLLVRTGPSAGKVVVPRGRELLIGRDPSADLRLEDERASRRHALVVCGPDGTWELRDLGSTNGTHIDGAPVHSPVRLAPGMQIQVGETALTVLARAPEPSAHERPTGHDVQTDARSVRRRLPAWALVGVGVLGAGAVALGAAFATGILGGGGARRAAGSAPAPMPLPDIVSRLTAAVAAVDALSGGRVTGGGSGWILSASEGLVVTNAHVVDAGDAWRVSVGNVPRAATLVGVAPCEDVALLHVNDTSGLRTMPLGSQRDLRQGDSVVVLGFPGSGSRKRQLTATTGIVSVARTRLDQQTFDTPNYPNVIQTDAAINPGNSGGPLVSVSQGKLVGMSSAGITLLGGRLIQGEGYAIGADRLAGLLPQLRGGRSPGSVGLGFGFVDDPAEQRQLGLPASPGLLVAAVAPGSAAERKGLQAPALVTAVNGRDMDGALPTYCRTITGLPQGTPTLVTVVDQSGAQRDVSLPLG